MAELAGEFGNGKLICTSRLAVEIPGIPYDRIQEARQFAAEHGMRFGGTGAKIRPVTACKGTTCVFGNFDTQALAARIHQQYYLGWDGVKLPHKFKIAVGGCPNSCMKPSINDFGVEGHRVPAFDRELCKGCKVCQLEKSCPIHAARLTDGKLVIDPTLCNSCGRCVGKCPFHCNDEGAYGWKVYVGGRWGKRVARGQMLSKLFTDKAEVLDVVEKAILLFRDQGKSGERFADTIARIGFENAEAQLLGDELLKRKAEILGLNVVGGASC